MSSEGNDVDLSFESLTFGDQAESTSLNNNSNAVDDTGVGRGRGASTTEQVSISSVQLSVSPSSVSSSYSTSPSSSRSFSTSASATSPLLSSSAKAKRTTVNNSRPTKRPPSKSVNSKPSTPADKEPKVDDLYGVFIYAKERVNGAVIVARVEELLGADAVRVHHFRDKQTFGFVQLFSDEIADKLTELLSGTVVDGVSLSAERSIRVTPGRDPRLQDPTSEMHRNATLVIKNLPFTMQYDELMQFLNSYEFKPISVAFHRDTTGAFRGMAFAKYTGNDEATAIFNSINGVDVGGRAIRIEYKRKGNGGVPVATGNVTSVAVASSQNSTSTSFGSQTLDSTEEQSKILGQLQNFKDNSFTTELSFSENLSSIQRRNIHLVADKLGLVHYSVGDGEGRHIIVSKKEKPEDNNNSNSRNVGIKVTQGRSRRGTEGSSWQEKNKWGQNGDKWTTNGVAHSPSDGFSWRNGKSNNNSFSSTLSTSLPHNSSTLSSSPKKQSALDKLGTSPSASQQREIVVPCYQPIRQPKGPDGTKGFDSDYQLSRSNPARVALAGTPVEPATPQVIVQ